MRKKLSRTDILLKLNQREEHSSTDVQTNTKRLTEAHRNHLLYIQLGKQALDLLPFSVVGLCGVKLKQRHVVLHNLTR